jgi:hypothetical protein
MTPQEIFNTAYLAVIEQGRPSVKKDGDCAYRGVEGAKCAIGHLIDDATAERWDKYGSTDIYSVSRKAKIKPDWLDSNIELLRDIQGCHDIALWEKDGFVEDYKQRMLWVAKSYNLTVPELSA